MKMGIGIFFGILLILAGIGLILKIIFNIDLPVFKILFALLFIYIGIKMLTGDFRSIMLKDEGHVVLFGETHYKGVPKNHEFTVIFGSAKLDLSGEDFSDPQEPIQINTIFGKTDLIISDKQPLTIKADAAFAANELPDKNHSAFGTVHYTTPGFEKNNNIQKIEVNSVFAKLEVFEKR